MYDLSFQFEERGTYTNGKPMPPHIVVSFEQAFGVALTFTSFKVQAIERREIEGMINNSG